MSSPAPAPAPDGPVLQVADLSVTFGQRQSDVRAVRGLTYSVRSGEFLGIVGESGSGKSVSVLAVMGLLPSNARVTGEVRFRGESLLGRSDKEMSRLRGRDLAMIFQDPLSALTPVYTIGDQIAETIRLHDSSVSKQAAFARSVELLKAVGIPAAQRRARAYPHEFSGGMRQRVMIAIAMANNPSVIIADEPTTALDVTIQAQILEVLQTARELTGAAVVLITHDLGVVAGNADRVAVMYAGRLVEQAPVDDLFARPQMPYTLGLLRSVPNLLTAGKERLVPLQGRPPDLADLPPGCPFQPRCPIAIQQCGDVEPPLATAGADPSHLSACLRAGQFASGELTGPDVFPRPAPVPVADRAAGRDAGVPSADREVLSVHGLVRHFPLMKGAVFRRRVGTVKAVDGVSFELGQGRTLGLVGESGCGKSTTTLEVLELRRPQAGTIRVNGTDVASLSASARRAMRSGIQIVFQDPMAAVDPRLPVYDVVAEPLTVGKIGGRERQRRVAQMLELVGLDPAVAGRYPHEFSGGQRQRIGIARALITNPKILVLDEPVSALDVSIQADVINLFEDLRDRLGLSYLFVAHDLAVVRQIADDVAVMYLGRIVEQGPVEEVYGDPRHPYTRALMSAVPVPDPPVERVRDQILLSGDLPSPAADITGCNFATRCPLYALLGDSEQAQCREEDPSPRRIGKTSVACHHAERIGALSGEPRRPPRAPSRGTTQHHTIQGEPS